MLGRGLVPGWARAAGAACTGGAWRRGRGMADPGARARVGRRAGLRFRLFARERSGPVKEGGGGAGKVYPCTIVGYDSRLS